VEETKGYAENETRAAWVGIDNMRGGRGKGGAGLEDKPKKITISSPFSKGETGGRKLRYRQRMRRGRPGWVKIINEWGGGV
jgi:hypothetical protein